MEEKFCPIFHFEKNLKKDKNRKSEDQNQFNLRRRKGFNFAKKEGCDTLVLFIFLQKKTKNRTVKKFEKRQKPKK